VAVPPDAVEMLVSATEAALGPIDRWSASKWGIEVAAAVCAFTAAETERLLYVVIVNRKGCSLRLTRVRTLAILGR
jgi:hypothetical protein